MRSPQARTRTRRRDGGAGLRAWPLILAALVLAAGGPASAQESASYRIRMAVFNAGGRPLDGAVPASMSFTIRPDSIGDGIVGLASSSASFRLSSGIVQAFPPPGEVRNLRFLDQTTLSWDAEPFAQHYHLYRAGPMGTGTGVIPVGDCAPPDVAVATTQSTDVPLPGRAYFYFVNAVSGTGTEGPKGTNGLPCP